MNYDVVIPMRNGITFIGEALDSIFNQTLSPGKVIVVNDHSTDGGAEYVIRNFPKALLLNSNVRGQANALNFGIEFSKSRFISFLDADDLWAPRKQEIQISLLESNSKMSYVSSGVRNFRGEDKDTGPFQDFPDSKALGACTFRREIFMDFGLFNIEEFSKVFVYEYFSRIRELPRVSSNTIEMFRRIHPNNSWITERDELRGLLFRFLRENR